MYQIYLITLFRGVPPGWGFEIDEMFKGVPPSITPQSQRPKIYGQIYYYFLALQIWKTLHTNRHAQTQ